MRIAIDADEAGLELKKVIYENLRQKGFEIVDLNVLGRSRVEYPDIAHHLARKVASHEYDRGILICGTGLGMAMVANKVEGAFAGTCHDTFSAERLKKSNDANIITLGARVIGPELAKAIVTSWLNSEFEAGRSAPKVSRMREIEKLEISHNHSNV